MMHDDDSHKPVARRLDYMRPPLRVEIDVPVLPAVFCFAAGILSTGSIVSWFTAMTAPGPELPGEVFMAGLLSTGMLSLCGSFTVWVMLIARNDFARTRRWYACFFAGMTFPVPAIGACAVMYRAAGHVAPNAVPPMYLFVISVVGWAVAYAIYLSPRDLPQG